MTSVLVGIKMENENWNKEMTNDEMRDFAVFRRNPDKVWKIYQGEHPVQWHMLINKNNKEVWTTDCPTSSNHVSKKLKQTRANHPDESIILLSGSHGCSAGDHYTPYAIQGQIKAIRKTV